MGRCCAGVAAGAARSGAAHSAVISSCAIDVPPADSGNPSLGPGLFSAHPNSKASLAPLQPVVLLSVEQPLSKNTKRNYNEHRLDPLGLRERNCCSFYLL